MRLLVFSHLSLTDISLRVNPSFNVNHGKHMSYENITELLKIVILSEAKDLSFNKITDPSLRSG